MAFTDGPPGSCRLVVVVVGEAGVGKTRLVDELAAWTPTLRVRLRGRRAVVAMSLPGRFDEAVALGDDAVAWARSIGDADVLVKALSDRLFVLSTPADYDMRAAVGEEILELARATGRHALALRGYEWSYASKLGTGDLRASLDALNDLEALAAIMPSPHWRWAAALRRCGLLALLGDYEGAMHLCGVTRELAAGVAPAAEASGLEDGLRLCIGALYGRTDQGVGQFNRENLVWADDAPLLFLQAGFALTEVLLGDRSAALRRLAPWRGRLDAGLRGPEGLVAVGLLAHAAVLLDWKAGASELRDLLRPFSGRLVSGNGVMVGLPVDHHLAAPALLDGDFDEATKFATDSLDFARRMGAPAIEARTLDLLDAAGTQGPTGAASTKPTAGAGRRRVAVHLDNGRCFVESPFGAGHVADSTGMTQLLRLVAAPGSEIAAVDLAGAATGVAVVVQRDLGPAFDACAKREYRRRIAELHADIDEADDHNDLARATRHRLELDALLDQLRAAVGLGGRDRPQGAGDERARINVSRTVCRAIAAIAGVVPDLGAHLDVSVRTGNRCSYRPEPAARLDWQVGTRRT